MLAWFTLFNILTYYPFHASSQTRTMNNAYKVKKTTQKMIKQPHTWHIACAQATLKLTTRKKWEKRFVLKWIIPWFPIIQESLTRSFLNLSTNQNKTTQIVEHYGSYQSNQTMTRYIILTIFCGFLSTKSHYFNINQQWDLEGGIRDNVDQVKLSDWNLGSIDIVAHTHHVSLNF